MSMNLYIEATQEAIFCKSGEKTIVRESFSLWQTPTSVTRQCLESTNPLEFFKKWVLDNYSEEVEEPIYSSIPLEMLDCKIVGTKKVNYAEEHVKELESWIDSMQKKGFDIKFYEM